MPGDTQVVDSDFHVRVSSKFDFLTVGSDHCENLAIAVLVEPFKDDERCSRPLKVDESVFFVAHFDFVGQVFFAELALKLRKSVD